MCNQPPLSFSNWVVSNCFRYGQSRLLLGVGNQAGTSGFKTDERSNNPALVRKWCSGAGNKAPVVGNCDEHVSQYGTQRRVIAIDEVELYFQHMLTWDACGFGFQKQVSQAGISNCIPQYSVGCNYFSLPEIPACVPNWEVRQGIIKGNGKLRVNLSFKTWWQPGQVSSYNVLMW